MRATTKEAERLLFEGTLAMSELENNGIRIDMGYLDGQINKVEAEINDYQRQIRSDHVYEEWRKTYGDKTNIGSKEQLAKVIFEKLGFVRPKGVSKKQRSEDRDAAKRESKHDEATFKDVDLPFVKMYFRCEKLKKLVGTYLKGFKREAVDGLLHPFFDLNKIITYRSSASMPNFQNIPSRNKEIMQIVRRCFIPRPGRQLVEIDYSGVEVRIAACYHKDPAMIKYIKDSSTDMHRDMAMKIFGLTKEQVGKKTTRDWSKNRFVFPEFYGSVYFQCAPNLWRGVVGGDKLEGSDVTVQQHLANQGIKELGDCEPGAAVKKGTFVHRVKQAEDYLWNETFTEYTAWKNRWHKAYLKKGYFDLLTGFRIFGLFKRNDVLNYAIQGCLQGHSRVLTWKGWIPIQELIGVQTRVWTGTQWADAVGINRGKCQYAKVTLSSGLVIDCDTRHKFKNELDEWVKFTDLKINDNVALSVIGRKVNYSGQMNWPFVFGFIIGDGCLSSKRESLTITVGKKKKDVLRGIMEFLIKEGYNEDVYGGVHWGVVPAKGIKAEKYRLSIQNRGLAKFLKSKGFDFNWKAFTKRLPDSVWTMDEQDQRDFMEGLWLSDGTRTKGSERNLNMRAQGLLRDVQILISNLGFDSQIDKRGQLRVCWRDFNSKSHRKFPRAAIDRMVDNVHTGLYEDVKQGITDRRNYVKGQDVSQYVAERMIKVNSKEEYPILYRYDKVTKIEILEEVGHTYTMSVNHPLHQFVADGVICKNSAFHCLLQSIVWMIKRMRKEKFKTLLVGQIHDCVVADAVEGELDDFLSMAHEIMVDKLTKAWTWINIPIETETEVCDIGKSWNEKAVWVSRDGIWGTKQ